MNLINHAASTLVHGSRLVRHALHNLQNASARSSHWPVVMHDHLKKFPACAACGNTDRLNVHHKQPFHLYPELELTESNLITLCMSRDSHCHLLLGHGDNFKCYVPTIEQLAATSLRAPSKRDELREQAKQLRLTDKQP